MDTNDIMEARRQNRGWGNYLKSTSTAGKIMAAAVPSTSVPVPSYVAIALLP